jgi:Tfp pilus assembly protein PilF
MLEDVSRRRRANLYTFIFCCMVAAFGAVLSGCASSAKNEERALLHLQMGMGSLNQGQYPQALKELLTAEELAPNNAIIQNNLAIAYYVRERYDLAEQHLRRALDIDPAYTEARVNLSRVLIERSQYPAAEVEVKKALDDLTYVSPEKAWFNYGLLNFRQQKYETAKDAFYKALQTQRENCEIHSYYGRSLFELKDYKSASEALDKAVSFCKGADFDEPHYYSALSYYHMGMKSKAVARLEEVISFYTNGKYKNKAKEMLQIISK